MKSKKTRAITVRLTEGEFFNIQYNANSMDMAISEYIRHKAVPIIILIE